MKLPISFIESTRALMGDEEYQELSVALEQEPPASVRLNSKFPGLAACSSISGRIPWAAEGYYLNQRLTFTFDPLFMPDVITCRKPRRCLWNRCSAVTLQPLSRCSISVPLPVESRPMPAVYCPKVVCW